METPPQRTHWQTMLLMDSYSLGISIEWKLSILRCAMGFVAGNSYSLGISIEWKQHSRAFKANHVKTQDSYSLGISIEWKHGSTIDLVSIGAVTFLLARDIN